MNILVENKQPLQWVQNAKGWGILFIALGHFAGMFVHWFPGTTTSIFALQYKYFYSFHVELFFFLSGLTFFHDKTPWRIFLKKKTQSLLWPYFFWGILGIVMYGLFSHIYYDATTASTITSRYHNMNADNDLFIITKDLLLGRAGWATSVLWFLFALFTFEILFYLYLRFVRTPYYKLYAVAICFVVAYAISHYSITGLPFGLQRAFTLGIFFSIGYCLQPYIFKLEKIPFSFGGLLFFILVVVLGCMLGILNDFSAFATTLPTFCLFVGTALCSILGWCGVSIFVKNKVMADIGKNSLGIMLTHKYPMLAFQVLAPYFILKLFQLKMASLSMIHVISLYMVSFLFIMATTYCATRILQKWTPWCFGKFTR